MTNRALVVAPNAGVSLSYGGGCKVAVDMAEALLESGYMVGLAAFHGLSPGELERLHGVNLGRFGGSVRTFYFVSPESGGTTPIDRLSRLLPTYMGVMPLALTGHLGHIMSGLDPSITVFHDDVPSHLRGVLRRRRSLLYAHFPMAARLNLGDPEERETEPLARKLADFLMRPLLRQLIAATNPPCELTVANSTVTRKYIISMWGLEDVDVLYPSIESRVYRCSPRKENLLVSVGALQPNKRFGEVVDALSKVRFSLRYVIIGHLREASYYSRLMSSIAGAGLKRQVLVQPNMSRAAMIDALSRAKIVVHASRFEPFGLSVLEGMASGCVPIVYRGETSGPWIDILDKGEYGLGFRSQEELAENIERIMSDEKVRRYYAEKAIARSREFDVRLFKRKFLSLLERKAGIPMAGH